MEDWEKCDLIGLAANWFGEIRTRNRPENLDDSFGSKVTDLSFFAPAEVQWKFLKIASNMAENRGEFGYVAAFSFEQFMSKHGQQYIDEVERLASESDNFKSIVNCSWRHSIDRKTWKRIE